MEILTIHHIRKRDGRIVKFDRSRIVNAIFKAFVATKSKDGKKSEEIADQVVKILEERQGIPSVEEIQDIVEEVLIKNGYAAAAKAYILYRKKRTELRKAKEFFGVRDELKLSVNAIHVLERRYLLKDEDGNVIETPSQLFRRVAKAAAMNPKEEEEFFKVMTRLEFLPNSPTLMNAGTRIGQLSACFVIPVEDSLKSIFDAVKHMAIIQQSGGGTGFSFSHLRPSGDIVKSTKGVASGPVSFMRIFDTTTDVIKQGGKRRGANMGILRIDHPDIIEFITSKSKEGFLSNFNISVAINDRFMEALKKDEEYELINPRNKEVVRKLQARDIWNLIVTMAWRTGDPGVVFIDEINRHNPTPHIGEIESTNPCITGDTFIITTEGAFQVKELVGKQTKLALNGKFYATGKEGFYKTGVKKVIKIITDKGYEIKLTEDHAVKCVIKKTRYNVYEAWKKAGEFKEGDEIILSNNRGLIWYGRGTFEQGYLLGLLLGDCTFKKEAGIVEIWGKEENVRSVLIEVEKAAKTLHHRADFHSFIHVASPGSYRMKLLNIAAEFGILPGNKKVTEELEKTSYEFHIGFLRGIFDANGTVTGDIKKGTSIRLWLKDLSALKTISRMLARLGIISKIYENRKNAGYLSEEHGYKTYKIKAGHELVITNDNILVFAIHIGFSHPEKAEKLNEKIKSYKRKTNRERFVAKVKRIESVGYEEVYDVNVPGINAFDANAICVHNCGEQPLLPYESCNLGSINLAKMVKNKEIDWDKLEKTITIAVRFLDNVIDVNKYPIEEIRSITLANRKIGLGVMGFADMLVQLGIPYNSEEALKKGEEIMRFIQEKSHAVSEKLAEEKGEFPNFPGSIYHKPIRNATVTTIAPTGSISIIAGCSSGIEPLFAVSFVRNVLEGTKLIEANPYFEKVAKEQGFYSEALMMKIAKQGGVKDIEEIPENIKQVFVTAFEIEPEWHVRMQAIFQKYCDNAVSKTINLSHDANIKDVEKAYMLAYELKCKGVTVYRYGSKSKQVLYLGNGEMYVSADSEYAGGCPAPVCPGT